MDWNDSIAAARDVLSAAQGKSKDWLADDQRTLAKRMRLLPLPLETIGTVAGVDVQYEVGKARAAVAVLDRKSLTVRNIVAAESPVEEEYEFGFLAYRELPIMLKALALLDGPPDVIIYDGNGTLHPRKFGAACHLGTILDVPTIGVSKNVSRYRPFTEQVRGETRLLENGSGALLVTRDSTNPVCVSPGHLTNLETAIELALSTSLTRIPEPIRLADRTAGQGSAFETH